MKDLFNRFVAILFVCAIFMDSAVADRWWPVQKPPKGVVKSIRHDKFKPIMCPDGEKVSGEFSPEAMMVWSLSGLAAKAVNEGTCDEMIWIEVGNPVHQLNLDYQIYYKMAKEKLGFEERGQFGSWELLKRFYDKGIVKSYVLYDFDYSKGNPYSMRKEANHSANAATMVAGVMGAVLIDDSLEGKARSIGLSLAYDARDKSVIEVFHQFKDKLNRNCYASLDPKVGHCRDFAVAYSTPVAIGYRDPVPEILQWLKPLSPIIGYLWEDEGLEVEAANLYGHFYAATNWSLNMPLLMAASNGDIDYKVDSVNPKQIDFDNIDKACSFVMSDGDNLAWMTGDFVHNKYYWASPEHGKFKFNWTSCFVNLSQQSMPTVDYLLKNAPANTSFFEYGGGYQYPDAFGKKRENRKQLLTDFAKMTWSKMEQMNMNVFGFLVLDFDNPAAIEAYEIYAKNMPGLVGMVAVQYHPYEGGPDSIIWVKNDKGIEIPVMQASYALWSNYGQPTGGTPSEVAKMINTYSCEKVKQGKKAFTWTIIHAWSGFHNNCDDIKAENGNYAQEGTDAGVGPTEWTVNKLDRDVKVVSLEELLWLIRMDHNPQKTRELVFGKDK